MGRGARPDARPGAPTARLSSGDPVSKLPRDGRGRLGELLALFARLGATAFGGPLAHVALMRAETVRRRRWLSEEAFLDLVGATALIPGPNSTELAMHLGWLRAGGPGLLVAGLGFIVPGMLMTMALAWAYVRWGTTPAAISILAGVKPVVVALVVQALAGLLPKAVKSVPLGVLGLASAVAVVAGAPEIAVLAGAGSVAAVAAGWRPPMLVVAPLVAVPTTSLFGVFAKIGSVLFGSGYVLVAFLRSELVAQRGWLTEGQLLDAVAAGQVTPGPVFTTATFVGWLAGGPGGAIAATIGIFLPAFVLVAASGPLVPRLRRSRTAGAFLDGVNVASLALMSTVAVELARSSVDGPVPAVLLAGAALALLRGWLGPTALLAIGALVG